MQFLGDLLFKTVFMFIQFSLLLLGLDFNKFSVSDSSSCVIINGNSYDFFFMSFGRSEQYVPRHFSWVETFLLVTN